ncbi:MAG: hypothetical protein ACO3NJ_03745 [Candidatus Poseidoniaceae archaeon]|jgi:hypothetical protein
MATKKTAPFMLTERLTLPTAGARVSATIDLGSYVDVGDRQAILIHKVDFIHQGTTATEALSVTFGAGSEVITQVLDLNRGGFSFANDRALIAGGRLSYEVNGGFSNEADLYPDNFGKGALEGRIVVNDTLYCESIATTLAAAKELNVTVQVTASIVTLSQKDFMAIAIQSTAADN